MRRLAIHCVVLFTAVFSAASPATPVRFFQSELERQKQAPTFTPPIDDGGHEPRLAQIGVG